MLERIDGLVILIKQCLVVGKNGWFGADWTLHKHLNVRVLCHQNWHPRTLHKYWQCRWFHQMGMGLLRLQVCWRSWQRTRDSHHKLFRPRTQRWGHLCGDVKRHGGHSACEAADNFFIFQSFFEKIFINRSLMVRFSSMNPDLGAMAFGAKETRLDAMANGAEVLARRRTWRWSGADVDKTSTP